MMTIIVHTVLMSLACFCFGFMLCYNIQTLKRYLKSHRDYYDEDIIDDEEPH